MRMMVDFQTGQRPRAQIGLNQESKVSGEQLRMALH